MTALILLCFLIGSAAVTVGAGLIYMPAGIIAGGILLIVFAAVLICAAASRKP